MELLQFCVFRSGEGWNYSSIVCLDLEMSGTTPVLFVKVWRWVELLQTNRRRGSQVYTIQYTYMHDSICKLIFRAHH